MLRTSVIGGILQPNLGQDQRLGFPTPVLESGQGQDVSPWPFPLYSLYPVLCFISWFGVKTFT